MMITMFMIMMMQFVRLHLLALSLSAPPLCIAVSVSLMTITDCNRKDDDDDDDRDALLTHQSLSIVMAVFDVSVRCAGSASLGIAEQCSVVMLQRIRSRDVSS